MRSLPETTLEIVEGESVVIYGPNGCGKSTLLKILSTLVIPTSGTCTINGHDILESSSRIRNLVGYVPDQVNFDKFMVSLDIWKAVSNLRGSSASSESFLDYMHTLGLGSWIDRPAGIYSTGMKKRMALALWLSFQPKILLLDELDASLDLEGLGLVADILRELDDITLVSVSHHGEYQLRPKTRRIDLLEHQERK